MKRHAQLRRSSELARARDWADSHAKPEATLVIGGGRNQSSGGLFVKLGKSPELNYTKNGLFVMLG